MSAKNFRLSIVGLKLNCTAACVLRYIYNLSLNSVESFKYPIAGELISKETEALRLLLDFFHKPCTNRCDRVQQPSATKTIGF